MSYIGIDLGTTNCCAAIAKSNVVVINGEDGRNLIASRVFFPNSGDELVVGNGAEAQKRGTGTVIYDSKRLIGRKYSDPKVQEDKWNLNYEIDRDRRTDDIIVKVPLKNSTVEFTPEEISSYLLRKIKSNVECKIGEVKGAVITVPAYFGTNQREKTKKAAELAGLNVIDIIDEPTAAAIGYDCENEGYKIGKILLVYDFGGGTFDVSIIRVNHPDYKVLCVGGDSHLGGEDITNNLVNYFCNLYKEKTGEDLRVTKKNKIRTLRSKCELLKLDLSSLSETEIDFNLFEEEGINCKMTLSNFNEINKEFFDNTIRIVNDTIERSSIDIGDINEIILVGGSCRNKRVKEMLAEHYPGKILKEDLNPDEIVAKGAAILAKNRDNDTDIRRRGYKVLVQNIVTHNLGIKISDGTITKMIERGSERGKKVSKVFSNTSSTELRFVVYEGDLNDIKQNIVVGVFKIDGFPPSPVGSIRIKVIFEVDEQGVLNISVYNPSYGLNKTMVYTL